MRPPVVADTVTLREFAESRRLDLLQKTFTGASTSRPRFARSWIDLSPSRLV